MSWSISSWDLCCKQTRICKIPSVSAITKISTIIDNNQVAFSENSCSWQLLGSKIIISEVSPASLIATATATDSLSWNNKHQLQPIFDHAISKADWQQVIGLLDQLQNIALPPASWFTRAASNSGCHSSGPSDSFEGSSTPSSTWELQNLVNEGSDALPNGRPSNSTAHQCQTTWAINSLSHYKSTRKAEGRLARLKTMAWDGSVLPS